MHLFCPTCQTVAMSGDRCPRCEGRLISPSETLPLLGENRTPPELIRPTMTGRVMVGSVTALGLVIAFHEWFAALVAAPSESSAPDEWLDLRNAKGFVFAAIMRFFAVTVGGLFSGAGRPNGPIAGATVGILCAATLVGFDVMSGLKADVAEIAVACCFVLAATAAGWMGGRLWPPAEEYSINAFPSRLSSIGRFADPLKDSRSRPTNWIRVILGVFVVAIAVMSADSVRERLKKFGSVGGPGLAPTVDLVLAALGIVVGGVIAGGNTGVGLRQGLIVGLVSGVLLGIAQLQSRGGSMDPICEGLFNLAGLPPSPSGFKSAALLFVAVLSSCVITSWFGGQLLPPVAPAHMFKSRLRD